MRSFLQLVLVISLTQAWLANAEPIKPSLEEKLRTLEASSGGRIGVSATNTANNKQIQHRAEERFPLGCTSKIIGVSAILKQSMKDTQLLQQRMAYTKEDLVSWSPITEKHLSEGMTISELGAAAITVSDNTAMNLLVKKMGGLKTMNAFARSIGDNSFRMDHGWPEEAKSGGEGNIYDSSTPAAMEKSLQRLVLGKVLALEQREQLAGWLKHNTTGDARIRAGLPKAWTVGDKTGTGSYYGTTNDVAVIWPPHCAPLVVAIYFTHSKKVAAKRDDIIASVMRSLLREFAQTDSCLQRSIEA